MPFDILKSYCSVGPILKMSPKSCSCCADQWISQERYSDTMVLQHCKRMLYRVVLDDGCDLDLTLYYVLFNLRGAYGFDRFHPFEFLFWWQPLGLYVTKKSMREEWIEWVMPLVREHMPKPNSKKQKNIIANMLPSTSMTWWSTVRTLRRWLPTHIPQDEHLSLRL